MEAEVNININNASAQGSAFQPVLCICCICACVTCMSVWKRGYVLTCQWERHKLHAFLAHDWPTETAVVPSVTNVKSVPAVWAEWHVRVAHPRNKRLLNCWERYSMKMWDIIMKIPSLLMIRFNFKYNLKITWFEKNKTKIKNIWPTSSWTFSYISDSPLILATSVVVLSNDVSWK